MTRTRTVLAALLATLTLPAAAGELTFTTGLDYSNGKYGTSKNSETWYVPIVAKYETGPVTLKMTVPYLHITNAVVGPDGEPVAGSGCGGTESGMGDITASAGYMLLDGTQNGLLVEAVGKVKMPTAENSCLGNNKTDYAVQFDFAKAFGATTGFATLGWKNMGNSNLDDPFYATLGVSYKLSQTTSLGVAYDWRDRLSSERDPISEMTVFSSHKLTDVWKLQIYAVKGFSDSSPEWGGGVMVSRKY
ncbi:MAG TPA: hypothetical protein VJ673_17090 [Aromatoleum sp.]|uniref:hypothetical protein n=1 Tax=Aromatoleum sp. TaxID=2307007 RepID=UPI002B461B22|nr:hypothetical protein [Aromatoleum sp.]HJV27407.1 hypothetical protein [Aromatoleum sp.]